MSKLKATDVMVPIDKVLSVLESDHIQKACGIIVQKRVGSVLVYNEKQKTHIGIVTKSDVVEGNQKPKLKLKQLGMESSTMKKLKKFQVCILFLKTRYLSLWTYFMPSR
jgi:CBS domain containing-hemolysin-like protein